MVLWAYMNWHVASAVYFCVLTMVFNIIFLALMVALILEMYVFVQELKKKRKIKSAITSDSLKMKSRIAKLLVGKPTSELMENYIHKDYDDIELEQNK